MVTPPPPPALSKVIKHTYIHYLEKGPAAEGRNMLFEFVLHLYHFYHGSQSS